MKLRIKNGFTLVEIIVVITILAIVAAFAIPSMMGFIEDSRTKECADYRSSLSGAFTFQQGQNASAGLNKETSESIFKKTVETVLQVTADDKGNVIGVCPKGGIYSPIFDEKGSLLEVVCSYHSEGNHIERGILALSSMLQQENSTIYQYFNGKQEGTSLDSTGPNYAPETLQELQKLGIDTNSTSWRVYKNKTGSAEQGYNIFWTDDGIISSEDITNKTVYHVTKFNTVTQTFETGTMTVRWNTSIVPNIPVLDGGSFKAEQ